MENSIIFKKINSEQCDKNTDKEKVCRIKHVKWNISPKPSTNRTRVVKQSGTAFKVRQQKAGHSSINQIHTDADRQ